MNFKSDKEFYLLNLGQKSMSEHRVKYQLVREQGVCVGGGSKAFPRNLEWSLRISTYISATVTHI